MSLVEFCRGPLNVLYFPNSETTPLRSFGAKAVESTLPTPAVDRWSGLEVQGAAPQPDLPPGAKRPASHPIPLAIPLFAHSIHAGFPSPAGR